MPLMQQMALVSETTRVSSSELSRVSAALQTQLTRDFGPLWSVTATIDAFARLEDVPPAYWPILIEDDIKEPGAAGVHNDKNGQPFALVQYSSGWSLTASHEMLEMSVDPVGNRLIQSQSAMEGQGAVEYLVEICDPCEADQYAYSVNGVLLSDFYTPSFFEPVRSAGVRYDFTGAITAPRQVLRGGYLSWHDPQSDHWWQELWLSGDQPQFKDLGPLDASDGSLRTQVDRMTRSGTTPGALAPAGAAGAIDASGATRARLLRDRIAAIKQAAKK